MIHTKYKWEIAIAGLIHDIGKVYQKSVESHINKVNVHRTSIEHTLIAKEFIEAHRKVFEQVFSNDEIKFITECAVRHHSKGYGNVHEHEFLTDKADKDIRRYCNIINVADNISSTERGETYHAAKTESKKENASLETPFTRMVADKSKDIKFELLKSAYMLTKYSDQSFKHKNIGRFHGSNEMTNHIKEFDNEVDRIKAESKGELFNKLNCLIKEYSWCLPSDSKEIVRDVSLYQHLITTSAIASAIYSDVVTCSKDENFSDNSVNSKANELKLLNIVMINSDKYILNSNKDSFKMINDISLKYHNIENYINRAVLNIVNKLALTEANIVINNGLSKYILITDILRDKAIEAIKICNEDLLREYNGEIYLSYKISDIKIEKTGEKNNGYEVTRMAPIFASENKYFKNGLTDILVSNGKWNTEKLILDTLKHDSSNIENRELIENKNSRVSIIMLHGDNIDDTLYKGFITNEKDYGTISRICTYCDIINNFFNGYIKENFSDVASILSVDKDKAILVCETSNSVEVIKDILDSYNEYTDGKLTLSVSVYNTNSNSKLINLYNNVKSGIDKCKSAGGNRIKLGDNLLTYDELDTYCYIKNIIADDLEKGVEKGVFNKLALYSDMYSKYIETKDVSKLKCVPLYNRGKAKSMKGISSELLDILNTEFDNIFKNTDTVSYTLCMLKNIIYDAQISVRKEIV